MIWIGYPTVEGLAAELEAGQKVYVCPVRDQVISETGIANITHFLYVQALEFDRVLYCRFKLGVEHDNGTRLRQIKTRGDEASHLVREYLVERGFVPLEALVARPTELRLMDGWADFLRFNDETGAVELRQEARHGP